MGVGDIFQVGGSGGSYLWVGDVRDCPLHGPGPSDFQKQGGLSSHRKTSVADLGRKLVVPPLGGGDVGGNVGGEFGDGEGVRLDKEECSRALLIVLDLCEEFFLRLGTWVSKK